MYLQKGFATIASVVLSALVGLGGLGAITFAGSQGIFQALFHIQSSVEANDEISPIPTATPTPSVSPTPTPLVSVTPTPTPSVSITPTPTPAISKDDETNEAQDDEANENEDELHEDQGVKLDIHSSLEVHEQGKSRSEIESHD